MEEAVANTQVVTKSDSASIHPIITRVCQGFASLDHHNVSNDIWHRCSRQSHEMHATNQRAHLYIADTRQPGRDTVYHISHAILEVMVEVFISTSLIDHNSALRNPRPRKVDKYDKLI